MLQLRPKLSGSARPIDRTQGMLPEASPHWEQWVILHKYRFILATRADPSANQMAIDLAGVVV